MFKLIVLTGLDSFSLGETSCFAYIFKLFRPSVVNIRQRIELCTPHHHQLRSLYSRSSLHKDFLPNSTKVYTRVYIFRSIKIHLFTTAALAARPQLMELDSILSHVGNLRLAEPVSFLQLTLQTVCKHLHKQLLR